MIYSLLGFLIFMFFHHGDTQDTTTVSTSVTLAPGCTETDASWLVWSEWSACSDSCGSCGVHIKTRTCLTTSKQCSCPGESTSIEFCNLEICRYPRPPCCYNLQVATLSARFGCLDNATN